MGLKIGVNVRFRNATPWSRPWEVVYREHLEYATAADRLGFDGVWVPEHHCVPSGYNPAPFTALGALAMVTKRCWLGAQPLLLPLYNPVLAAEQTAVVDVLSGGRMILGVGVGYREGDFDAIGFDKKDRGALLDETLAVLLKALEGGQPFNHDGRFYHLKDVKLYPEPVRPGKLEVQLAVRSAPAARRAVKLGLNVSLHSREAAMINGPIVAEGVAARGIDPASIGVGLLRSAFLGESEMAGRAAIAPYMAFDAQEYDAWQQPSDPDDQRLIALRRSPGDAPKGLFTPDSIIEAFLGDAAAIRTLGLRPDWINVSLWPPGMPLAEALDCLERFAAQVLPHVQGR